MAVAQVRETDATAPVVRKLSGTLGAEIRGVRMAGADAGTVDVIRRAVLAHRVVAVRDQFLGVDDLLDFGAKLGPFMQTRASPADKDRPQLLRITNPGKTHALSENWHTDGTTSEKPPSFSVLAAQTIPEAGGDTLFVDMGYAYRTLSPSYRRMLRGLRAHHLNRLLKADTVIECWHPMVRTIPETGERVLYPGFPNICDEIEGMSRGESKSLLDFLFEHATRHDGLYRHRWLPGDVLLWDNRTTMHYAVHDYGDAQRDLVRVMIEGERPFEAPYRDDEN
jgi:taurine dioxygenase